MSGLRDAAIRLAAKGKPVFPCRPAGKEPLKPLARHGFKDATTDQAVILHWWGSRPDSNIGMATGRPSGLFVLDVDPAHGGEATLARMCAAGDGLDTLEATTGGGGLHLYFLMPADADLTNSNARIKGKFGPGVDCRGSGGYVIAPPSRHPSGGRYRWGPGTPRPVPRWLVQLLTEPARPRPAPQKPAGVLPFDTRQQRQAVRFDQLLRRVAQAPEGQRNDLLFWAACRLAELLEEGAPGTWTAQLVDAGVAAGLDPAETRRTVTSGLRRAAS